MADDAPAWALESMVLRLDTAAPAAASSPEWAFGDSTGAGVRVAIVDSGVDADHPDLDHCVDRDGGVDVTMDDDGEVSIRSGPHDDVFGHGTACAGIIHALAPEARLTSVRVLGPGLTGRAAAFHAGLAWAVDEGFDVINLSLGTTKRDWALAFHEVCDRAYFGGSFIVTAANNVARTSYPSLFASVASVACNTATDALRFHANPSPPTEFLARGIDVEVPWLDGGTTTSTGNSYAAPHIAAFAALAKAKHPELRPFELKAVLWAASANVAAAAGAGEDPEAPTAAGRRATATAGPGTATLVTRHLGPLVAEARAALDLGGGDTPPPPPPVAATPRRPAPPALLLPGYAAEDDGVDGPWGRRVPARREVDGWRCTVHDLRPVIGPDTALAAEVAAAVEVASRVRHPHLEEVTVLVPWAHWWSPPGPGPTSGPSAARTPCRSPTPWPWPWPSPPPSTASTAGAWCTATSGPTGWWSTRPGRPAWAGAASPACGARRWASPLPPGSPTSSGPSHRSSSGGGRPMPAATSTAWAWCSTSC